MLLRSISALFAVAFVAASCSSSNEHPPAQSNDCTANCDPIGTLPSGKQKDAGSTSGTGGSSSTDAAVTITPICGSDPTTGIKLCDRSDFCPGVVVDQTTLQGCGFVQLPSTGASVQCICNTSLLCPVATVPNCTTLPGLLSQQNTDTLCNQGITAGTCVDLRTVPVTRDGGRCSTACIQQCVGSPACLPSCGC